jgi:hypothetical protein
VTDERFTHYVSQSPDWCQGSGEDATIGQLRVAVGSTQSLRVDAARPMRAAPP